MARKEKKRFIMPQRVQNGINEQRQQARQSGIIRGRRQGKKTMFNIWVDFIGSRKFIQRLKYLITGRQVRVFVKEQFMVLDRVIKKRPKFVPLWLWFESLGGGIRNKIWNFTILYKKRLVDRKSFKIVNN